LISAYLNIDGIETLRWSMAI